MTRVYTKTGDKGTTSLANGERVSKCCDRLDAYGTVDELTSHIGMLRAQAADMADERSMEFLAQIQDELFVLGSVLAGYGELAGVEQKLSDMEGEIDRLSSSLPQIRSFIIPAGCMASCEAHICRTVCRRAERLVWRLEGEVECARFLNRLSDYFFVFARYLNVVSGVEEKKWR